MLIDAAILRDKIFNEFCKEIMKIITFLEDYKRRQIIFELS